MDALVRVKILGDSGILNDPTDMVINLNHMTHCVSYGRDSNGPEGVYIYFANRSHVIIQGNYDKFVTFVKSICAVHSFEAL